MAVDPTAATWLKADGKSIVSLTGTTLSDRTVELTCAADTAVAAQQIAARAAVFFAAPTVEEIVEVTGERADLFGRCIPLIGLPGVAGSAPVFVRKAEELAGVTRLTVIRRL